MKDEGYSRVPICGGTTDGGEVQITTEVPQISKRR